MKTRVRKCIFCLNALLILGMAFLFTGCGAEGLKILLKLKIDKNPIVTTYIEGQEFIIDGMEVIGLFSDGTIERIKNYTVTPTVGTKLQIGSNQKVTVSYLDIEESFFINVNPNKPEKLVISRKPKKTSYIINEKLDCKDLEISVIYSDGTTRIVQDYKISPEEGTVLSKGENQKITVSYLDVKESFSINVYDEVETLIMTSNESLLSFYEGDKISYSNIVLEATFKDGSTKIIENPNMEPESNTELTEVGKQKIKACFLDKNCEYEIEILPMSIEITENPEGRTFPLYEHGSAVPLKSGVKLTGNGVLKYQWYAQYGHSEGWSAVGSESEVEVKKEAGKEYDLSMNMPQSNYFDTKYYCKAVLKNNSVEKEASGESCVVTQTMPDTGIPTVYINTDDGEGIISKEEYKSAKIRIDAGSSGLTGLEEMVTEIKGRGNYSWGVPKKSYTLKLDSKNKVLGMPKSKKWVLVANYADKTLLRNLYASYLGKEVFNTIWNPSFESVDLILNGEFLGNYIIGEQIKIDEKRVNIQSAADTIKGKGIDVNGDGVVDLYDGGFILEVDNFYCDGNYLHKTQHGLTFVLKDPDTDDFLKNSKSLSSEVSFYVNKILDDAEYSLYKSNFEDLNDGYKKYLNLDSVIDWYLINEFTENLDSGFVTSVYMYYNPSNKKVYMGPNWDFDKSCGNTIKYGIDNPERFHLRNAYWFNRFYEDSDFIYLLKQTWNNKKLSLLTSILEISNISNQIRSSADLNFIRWKLLGCNVSSDASGWESRITYQSEVDYMINWLNTRYTWMDLQVNGF